MSQPKMYLLAGVGATGVGGISTYFTLPEVWQKHNYAALAVLVFPAIGIGFLIAFVRAWRSQRRFGDCFFQPALTPIPIGGVLDGTIQTGKPLKLEHELSLELRCIRSVVTGSGKQRHTSQYVLWQSDQVYSERAVLPESAPGHTAIPVHFTLPANQPECSSQRNESVSWQLEAKSKLHGPDFHAIFDLPVFKVADAKIPDAAAAENSDPTAALHAPIEEIRRELKSRIKVFDGSNGREFYFPPARNIGAACFMTLGMFLFNGIAFATYHLKTPILFPILFGSVGVLMVFGSFSIWTKSTCIRINFGGVRVTTRYLVFGRTRDFSLSAIARFAAARGMQSGSQVFTNIKLIPRGSDEKFAAEEQNRQQALQAGAIPDMNKVMAQIREAAGPSGVTVATGIASPDEANWLVDEMNKALGNN